MFNSNRYARLAGERKSARSPNQERISNEVLGRFSAMSIAGSYTQPVAYSSVAKDCRLSMQTRALLPKI